MINEYFEKVALDFKISGDPEKMFADLEVISNDLGRQLVGEDASQKILAVMHHSSDTYWHYFPETEIYFIRNLSFRYLTWCNEIIDKLSELQHKLREHPNKSWMVERFISHKLKVDRVGLMKVSAGQSVKLHKDLNRDFAINIGLKNSDSCTTYVYEGPIIEKTLINENSIEHSYTMNDGDVFLLATKYPHRVESNVNATDIRYVITYTV